MFKTKGRLFLVIIGLLACCVIMQMVGIRASLWDSNHIEDNSVESSIIGASALVAHAEGVTILSVSRFGGGFRPSSRLEVFLSAIFHPPDLS